MFCAECELVHTRNGVRRADYKRAGAERPVAFIH